MRPIEEIQRRWSTLDSSIGVDLREAVRDKDSTDPCENGLRSVCWKSFLLYGPLSQTTWPKKLAESRGAYDSLRGHFLRFIEHPHDLQSVADPLNDDDDSSPWSTLRQDESSREEIFQDVTRCMQENYYFREPVTQRKLLDILFIYSKLNPDTGYRQGMHEILAPILWVVHQDAIDATSTKLLDKEKTKDDSNFMLQVLDQKYMEHDAFSLFCAVMQTAKVFYEVGENRDSSPIIARSRRIHEELLAAIDPELALHLQVVGILPQIYSIRWIRLLFGREFEFKDVLRVWDLLFAESLRLDIIDLTCVAMLLRLRWLLVEADYTSAITALTHFKLPGDAEDPQNLVRDAMQLEQNRNTRAGALLIQQYTGRSPKGQSNDYRVNSPQRDRTPMRTRTPQHRPSPSPSPALLNTPQRQLENLFQEVSGGIQRRAEGWNVSKVVRGAVGEVKRNMTNFQNPHLRQPSIDILSQDANSHAPPKDVKQVEQIQKLEKQVRDLETRNKALSKMLENALESLRSSKNSVRNEKDSTEEIFNISLAKIQFVSVYLADPEIPIPPEPIVSPESKENSPNKTIQSTIKDSDADRSPEKEDRDPLSLEEKSNEDASIKKSAAVAVSSANLSLISKAEKTNPMSRPSLKDSSFSFMLGENEHRSGFVSSASDLPEQRRDSETKTRPKQLWAEEKAKRDKDRKGSDSEDDGFTMSKLHGSAKS